MSESKMHTLYQECGKPVQVNENSLEHALNVCGWLKDDPAKAETEEEAAAKAKKKRVAKEKREAKKRALDEGEAVRQLENSENQE